MGKILGVELEVGIFVDERGLVLVALKMGDIVYVQPLDVGVDLYWALYD